jgi:carbonic anhydrase/acetyltransferase-like protein (isoleucine patch superfamily)
VHHRRVPLFAFEGREPDVSPGAWIAPTATLVGDVRVEAEASGASVGRRALIAAGATVPPGLIVPDGMLAAGVPARIVGEVTGRAGEWVETNPSAYRELARRHAAGARPVDG